MAKDLNRSIKIYIDNSDAMQKSELLEKKISSLRAELQKLDAEGKKESKQYTASEKALAKMERTRGAHLNKVKETQRVLRDLSGSTYKELQQVQRALRADLQKSTRGTEEYNQKLKLYQSLQRQITTAQREMNGQLGAQSSLWSRMTAGFNKYFGIVSTFAASITGLSLAFRKLSQDAAAMEDVYDGVSKTTGFTRDQVQKLNEEFKKMDTRVPREELNKFAADAGKLGKETEEDILGFVNAAVRIRVGIGKDLGDDALIDIAKMTDIFVHSTKEMESMNLEERMIATGSAIRYLAKQSTAAEPPIVNFASRMTGIASQAKISMQDVLGFGSALDQLKQPTEMAATALQKFIMKMFTDTSKYAQIAGMDVAKFSTLLQTDANTAIKTVLRALNDKGGFSELAPIFQEMGLDGARAVGVLSALAANINMVDEAQRDANKSFAEATTLDEEYNIMNKNAQASLEKRRQAFKDAAEELGQRLNPALLKSTNILTYIIKFLPSLLDFLQKYGKYLAYLVTVYAAYNGAIQAAILKNKLQLKLRLELLGLAIKERASMIALNLQYLINSRSVVQFNRSLKALFATMKLNPIGAVTALVFGLGIAVYQLISRTTKLTDKAKALVDINQRVADSVRDERAELTLLLGVARNEKISKEQRLEAIERLNEISPEYLGNLDLENINTKAATTAVENYTTALMENARQKAIGDKVSDLYSKRLEQEAKIFELRQKLEDRRQNSKAKRDIDENLEYAIRQSEYEIEVIDGQIEMYDSLNQSIKGNTKTRALTKEENIQIAQSFLDDSVEILNNLEAEHADIYSKMTDTEAKFGLADDFASRNRLIELNKQIEAQKNVVEGKEKELELLKKQKEIELEDDPKGKGGGGDADKDIYKAKLEALNLYLAQRREALMRGYLAGNITHEQYLFQLEQLERESLDRQFEIYELDVVKQQEITNKILEYKLKAQQMLEESEHKHLLKLQELNEAADRARAEQNWKSLKQIAAQNEQHWNEERTRRNEQMAAMAGLAMDFADEMGTLIGGAMSGNEVVSNIKDSIY